MWDLQRCNGLVGHPHEARVEILMLDAVAIVVRREKTEGELWDARRVGKSGKETFCSHSQ